MSFVNNKPIITNDPFEKIYKLEKKRDALEKMEVTLAKRLKDLNEQKKSNDDFNYSIFKPADDGHEKRDLKKQIKEIHEKIERIFDKITSLRTNLPGEEPDYPAFVENLHIEGTKRCYVTPPLQQEQPAAVSQAHQPGVEVVEQTSELTDEEKIDIYWKEGLSLYPHTKRNDGPKPPSNPFKPLKLEMEKLLGKSRFPETETCEADDEKISPECYIDYDPIELTRKSTSRKTNVGSNQEPNSWFIRFFFEPLLSFIRFIPSSMFR